MKIKKFKFFEGAVKAEGLTVIIDVFRAYTTAAYLFANQAEYIQSKNPEIVSLVAMGNNGVEDADEDNLFAQELKKILKGNKLLSAVEIKNKLRSPAGDRFFAENTQTEMPKEDFEYCLKLNKFDFIIKAIKKTDDIYQLKKKEVK